MENLPNKKRKLCTHCSQSVSRSNFYSKHRNGRHLGNKSTKVVRPAAPAFFAVQQQLQQQIIPSKDQRNVQSAPNTTIVEGNNYNNTFEEGIYFGDFIFFLFIIYDPTLYSTGDMTRAE